MAGATGASYAFMTGAAAASLAASASLALASFSIRRYSNSEGCLSTGASVSASAMYMLPARAFAFGKIYAWLLIFGRLACYGASA